MRIAIIFIVTASLSIFKLESIAWKIFLLEDEKWHVAHEHPI